MEQAVFRLHLRFVRSFCYYFPNRARIYLEHLSLFNAIVCVVLLVYLHRKFIVSKSYHSCFGLSEVYSKQTDVFLLNIENELNCGLNSNSKYCSLSTVEATCNPNIEFNETVKSDCYSSYLFSFSKGYLLFPKSTYERHNIQVHEVNVSSTCFDLRVPLWIVRYGIGYDVIVSNYLISEFGGKGYLFDANSKHINNLFAASKLVVLNSKIDHSYFLSTTDFQQSDQYLRRISLLDSTMDLIFFKIGIVFTSLFLFFTSTTLVNFTLR